jgi:hypothetical protein
MLDGGFVIALERLCSKCQTNPVRSRRKVPICNPCEAAEREATIVKQKAEREAKVVAKRRSRSLRNAHRIKAPWGERTAFINNSLSAGRLTTEIVQDLSIKYPEATMKQLRNFISVQRRRQRRRKDMIPPEPTPFVPLVTEVTLDEIELAEEVIVERDHE